MIFDDDLEIGATSSEVLEMALEKFEGIESRAYFRRRGGREKPRVISRVFEVN